MISVIIPLYNKEKIIERTLRSVLSQDYDDFEVIIVDDGSTDSSLEIVEREYPKIKRELGVNVPVTVIKQGNGGPSKARNTGLAYSKGEWIYFIDADDTIYEHALKIFYNLISNYPNVDVFMGGIEFKNCKGISSYMVYKECLCKNVFKEIACNRVKPCTGSILYKREICLKNTYDESLRRYEDFERFFRISRTSKIFITSHVFLTVNAEYSFASNKRQNISEDFVGHLSFKGKTFWEKICLYKLFIEEREHYPIQIRQLFPLLFKRLDYYCIYKLISFINIFQG